MGERGEQTGSQYVFPWPPPWRADMGCCVPRAILNYYSLSPLQGLSSPQLLTDLVLGWVIDSTLCFPVSLRHALVSNYLFDARMSPLSGSGVSRAAPIHCPINQLLSQPSGSPEGPWAMSLSSRVLSSVDAARLRMAWGHASEGSCVRLGFLAGGRALGSEPVSVPLRTLRTRLEFGFHKSEENLEADLLIDPNAKLQWRRHWSFS